VPGPQAAAERHPEATPCGGSLCIVSVSSVQVDILSSGTLRTRSSSSWVARVKGRRSLTNLPLVARPESAAAGTHTRSYS
jgi:hypothetical protein